MSKTKNKKTAQKLEAVEETLEDLPFAPPDMHYLAEHYVVKIPLSHISGEKGWDLRLHVAKILQNAIGDEIELTNLKLRQPHLMAKSIARLRRHEPYARAYVTVKF